MKNLTPVGSSECPIKKCTLSVPVYRYRGASTDDKRRRFAGRLYCVCPAHGRVENQEFLLENITWHANEKPPADAGAATTAATTTRPTPAAAPRRPPSTPAQPSTPAAAGWLPEFWK
jgi:hypothetical protein